MKTYHVVYLNHKRCENGKPSYAWEFHVSGTQFETLEKAKDFCNDLISGDAAEIAVIVEAAHVVRVDYKWMVANCGITGQHELPPDSGTLDKIHKEIADMVASVAALHHEKVEA